MATPQPQTEADASTTGAAQATDTIIRPRGYCLKHNVVSVFSPGEEGSTEHRPCCSDCTLENVEHFRCYKKDKFAMPLSIDPTVRDEALRADLREPVRFYSVAHMQEHYQDCDLGNYPQDAAEYKLPGYPEIQRDDFIRPSFEDGSLGAESNINSKCLFCTDGPHGAPIMEPDGSDCVVITFSVLLTQTHVMEEDVPDGNYEPYACLSPDDANMFRVCIECVRKHSLVLTTRHNDEVAAVVAAGQIGNQAWADAIIEKAVEIGSEELEQCFVPLVK